MRDFIDHLERQLVLAGRAEAQRGPVSRLARSTAAVPRRWASVVAVAAAIVAGTVLSGLPTGPAPELAQAYAVFSKPAVDASGLLRAVPGVADLLRLSGLHPDPRHARAISTPWGTGYVLPADNGHSLCVLTPGGRGTWEGSCARGKTARYGTEVLLGGRYRRDAELVQVLPVGASAPVVRYQNGTTRTLTLRDGVGAIVVHSRVTVTWRVDGRDFKLQFAPAGICSPQSLLC
jgi:hypothetical protein